jgi:hypothetical protein
MKNSGEKSVANRGERTKVALIEAGAETAFDIKSAKDEEQRLASRRVADAEGKQKATVQTAAQQAVRAAKAKAKVQRSKPVAKTAKKVVSQKAHKRKAATITSRTKVQAACKALGKATEEVPARQNPLEITESDDHPKSTKRVKVECPDVLSKAGEQGLLLLLPPPLSRMLPAPFSSTSPRAAAVRKEFERRRAARAARDAREAREEATKRAAESEAV